MTQRGLFSRFSIFATIGQVFSNPLFSDKKRKRVEMFGLFLHLTTVVTKICIFFHRETITSKVTITALIIKNKTY